MFDIGEDDTLYFEVTKSILQKSLRSHRHRLKKQYYTKVKDLTMEQAMKLKPPTLSEGG